MFGEPARSVVRDREWSQDPRIQIGEWLEFCRGWVYDLSPKSEKLLCNEFHHTVERGTRSLDAPVLMLLVCL